MRFDKLTITALIACMGLSVSLSAHAQTANITFEGQSNTQYSAPILRQGYDIGNPALQEQHFHEIDSTQFSLTSNGTGVLLNDRDTQIFVIPDAGAGFTQFSLTSVDVATALNNRPATGLVLTGFLNNVVTGTINVASLGTGFTTLNGSSLGTVDTLLFDGIGDGGGFEVDNLILAVPAAVPEPGSVALLTGLSLTGAAFLRRRKQKANKAA